MFSKKRLIIVAVFCISAALLLWCAGIYGRERFDDAYGGYAKDARVLNTAAYLPGASGNPLRQEVNQILVEVLGKKMSDTERLKLSSRGVLLLKAIEKQINAMGDSAPAVQEDVARMDNSARNISNLYQRRAMLDIVALAKDELLFIEDIRGLSYRANFYTSEIFNKIIKSNGALTDAHVTQLNDQLPEVEEQFTRRSNLYTQLQQSAYKIEQKFNDL
jgi:hypothetical protein